MFIHRLNLKDTRHAVLYAVKQNGDFHLNIGITSVRLKAFAKQFHIKEEDVEEKD